jgi:hypothetical protein
MHLHNWRSLLGVKGEGEIELEMEASSGSCSVVRMAWWHSALVSMPCVMILQ